MNDNSAGAVRWSFWVIGLLAMLWHVMGILNYLAQLNAESVASLHEAQRLIVEGRPGWATGAFAVAVFAGALGCVLLLLRKSLAIVAFALSLVAVVVQSIPYLGMAGSSASFGGMEITLYIVMPVLVGALLLLYSVHVRGRGWIN